MIVVATAPTCVTEAVDRVTALGGRVSRVLSPSTERRLVLAVVEDAWAAERIVAALRAAGLIAVSRPNGGPRLDGWMEQTRPATFGDRLTVSVAWSEHDRHDVPGLIELGLGGFGNGRHPTTRLLVEELLQRIDGGERVLDVGCGSGILGLAALRLGATDLTAVDIDAASVEATRHNAALNGMADRLQAASAPFADLDRTFDVIVANVARAAIVELASDLVRLLSPGGWLAVSGISPSQGDQVAAFLRPLVEDHRVADGDWSAVVFTRSSPDA